MERARAFGQVAAEYDRGRPIYPAEAIRWLLGGASLEVVELGAGTGKLTAGLIAGGHRVTPVEPLAEMRAILADRAPEADVRDGTAEATRLPAGCCDAVVAGAAFHWFDRTRAFPEIQRLLRKPGVLGLLGNGFDTSVPWVARLRELLGGARLGKPGHWPEAEELHGWFAEVKDAEFPFTETIDRARLRDLALSRSSVATLPPGERDELLGRLDALWNEAPDLQGQTHAPLRYRTLVRRARGLIGEPG